MNPEGKICGREAGQVIWLYGRPCSGKTSISNYMAGSLQAAGMPVITLDGDELRQTINRDLGFSAEDRCENIRRAAELALLFALKDYFVICSFITPGRELREMIRQILQPVRLHLVYVDTPLEECIHRDVKGHYGKAISGKLDQFTGIGSPFAEPETAIGQRVPTLGIDVEEAAFRCLDLCNIKITEPIWTK